MKTAGEAVNAPKDNAVGQSPAPAPVQLFQGTFEIINGQLFYVNQVPSGYPDVVPVFVCDGVGITNDGSCLFSFPPGYAQNPAIQSAKQVLSEVIIEKINGTVPSDLKRIVPFINPNPVTGTTFITVNGLPQPVTVEVGSFHAGAFSSQEVLNAIQDGITGMSFTSTPTLAPIATPSVTPTPTVAPTIVPSMVPNATSVVPTGAPTAAPTSEQPTAAPTSWLPTLSPNTATPAPYNHHGWQWNQTTIIAIVTVAGALVCATATGLAIYCSRRRQAEIRNKNQSVDTYLESGEGHVAAVTRERDRSSQRGDAEMNDNPGEPLLSTNSRPGRQSGRGCGIQ